MINLLAKLIRRVQLRIAQLEAEERSMNPAALIRLICRIGEVPDEVEQGFIARGTACAEVARILAEAREYGGAEAMRTAEFLTDESAETWSAEDRALLQQMEKAFQTIEEK